MVLSQRSRATRRGAPPATKAWSSVLSHRAALTMMAPLAVALALFVLYPLVKLVVDSLTMGNGPGNYADALGSSAIRRSILVTLRDSALVTLLSVVGGTALAWAIHSSSRKWFKALVWAAVLVPFWMGVVVKNYAFALLLAREGPLNSMLTGLGVVGEPLQLMYTSLAVVLGMTYTMLPYAVLAVYPSMAAVDTDLLNAGRVMGASERRAFTTVLFPLIRPGAIAAAAIVFAMSIGFYVTPVLLGGAQTAFIATLIGDDIFRYFNYPRAAASSVILLVIALTTLLTTIRVIGVRAVRGGMG